MSGFLFSHYCSFKVLLFSCIFFIYFDLHLNIRFHLIELVCHIFVCAVLILYGSFLLPVEVTFSVVKLCFVYLIISWKNISKLCVIIGTDGGFCIKSGLIPRTY